MNNISVIDFEASSLGSKSFPIEVAWGNPDGNFKSYLNSPIGISAWTEWGAKSEALHDISGEHLIKHGLPPKVVVERLLASLKGRTVLSDNPEFDNHWLHLLLKAGGVSVSGIEIQDFKKYLWRIQMLIRRN